MVLRLATRGSTLAVAQSAQVARALQAHGSGEVELVRISTHGDRYRGPLASVNSTGVFVTAVREALRDGRADLAVHSLKDLPTDLPTDLVIAAHPARSDARDALCAAGVPLARLPHGSLVGTGSPRRRAQLLAVRPDLRIEGLRGNVDSRLAALDTGPLDAVVLAAAGLARLGRSAEATEVFDPAIMVPAPGQGSLAVECRAADLDTRRFLAPLDDLATRLCVSAERAVLAGLEAGCSAPVGSWAQIAGRHLRLIARVTALDGSRQLEHRSSLTLDGDQKVAVDRCHALGAAAATALLADGAGRLAPLTTTPPAAASAERDTSESPREDDK